MTGAHAGGIYLSLTCSESFLQRGWDLDSNLIALCQHF